jgi:glycosyltransferase involved in cell wall biosynthesis
MIFNLAYHVSKNGGKCRVLCLQNKKYQHWEPYEQVMDIRYSPFSDVYLGYLYFFFAIPMLRFKERYRYAFSSQTLINAMLGIIKQFGFLPGTRLIVRESNSIFHLLSGAKLRMYSLAYKIGYHKVDLLILQTEFMKNQLLEAMPWMKRKLRLIVLPNPINLGLIAEKAAVKNPSLKGRKFLVAAGRLVPAKGFDVLIDAFRDLHPSHPDLELIILGEGPEKSSLQSRIDSFGLSDKIFLEGLVTNVYPYFKNAAACVLSSRIEGFPNVLLQMMSQNTKVVSTLSAGGIEKLQGVFTCEIENTGQLAETIQKCLNSDTDQNRNLFDENLKVRTVDSFLRKTLENLPES